MDIVKLEIPIGTTEIKEREYTCNQIITFLEIPNTVKTIGLRAFALCPNLKVIIIPSSVEKIDTRAFYGDSAYIYIHKGVKFIGEEAFSNTSKVYFEGDKDSFTGYYERFNISDYPDSYHRGPSMGQETLEVFFYQERTPITYNVPFEEFLKLIKNA